ncbi:PAS domain S-box protein [bacterium]|nr:MAG: PAS domain S-box protein [bacterium]
MIPPRFSDRLWALLLIGSLMPTVILSASWYWFITDGTMLTISPRVFMIVAAIIAFVPSLAVGHLLKPYLAGSISRLHLLAKSLSSGQPVSHQYRSGHDSTEIGDITSALTQVSGDLESTRSQALSETALITAERSKLRSVLGAMTDGVFALDRTGRIILFNRAAEDITGRNLAAVAGQLAEKVLPFRRNGELIMTRWLADHADHDHQVGTWKGLELYHADGHSLYVNVQAVSLHEDPNGIAALITFHDLTASHMLEEMQVDFVALAAHELRTPITEIKASLDILAHEATKLTTSNRHFLDQAITSADELSSLLHNLLGVARIEHGELSCNPVPGDYGTFITKTAETLTKRALNSQRRLSVQINEPLPLVALDQVSIREVLTNLVDNALKHTPTKTGRVTITVTPYSGYVETAIEDNGEGIPENAISRLFTKFFRVNEMQSRTRGTGLGLYISRAIVEAHGGTIWAESHLGEGSTFTFRLPAVATNNRASNNNLKTNITTRGAHGWIKKHSIH